MNLLFANPGEQKSRMELYNRAILWEKSLLSELKLTIMSPAAEQAQNQS